MDEMQDRLVRVGLARLAEHGFALAGGYALQAHGLVDRFSEDVDLFTNRWDPAAFGDAVDAVVEAYRREGLHVVVVQQAETFARLEAADPESGSAGSVDLAADVRVNEPVTLSIGPVLAESDAVASKVAAVFSRGYARDYLDLAGILASGRYSRDQLMAMGRSADAGFTPGWFAQALAGVDRFSDDEFSRYGVDADHIAAVKETMRSWSTQLAEGPAPARVDGPAPKPQQARRTAAARARQSSIRPRGPEPPAVPDTGYQPPTREGPAL